MYSKTCVKRLLENRQTKILMINGTLMKVESIATNFLFFESGRLTQVLLYVMVRQEFDSFGQPILNFEGCRYSYVQLIHVYFPLFF